MPKPLNAHLANERTFLEWLDMSVTLGAVAAALFAVSGPNDGARVLAALVMPVAVAFAAYSGWQFRKRRQLLAEERLGAPEMQSTTGPVVLAAALGAALTCVFLVDVLGPPLKL